MLKEILRSRFLAPAMLIGAITLAAGSARSAENQKAAPVVTDPPYERSLALGTIMNPHNQINDEGEIIWSTCQVCHTNVPDIDEEKSLKDVKLRFAEVDLNRVCYGCHQVKKHPSSEGIDVAMSGFRAPDHLVVPPMDMYLNMRLSMKEVPIIMPLDPVSGKIVCSTCHNSHERGLLRGRADTGGDNARRLRSFGQDICQYCHRK